MAEGSEQAMKLSDIYGAWREALEEPPTASTIEALYAAIRGCPVSSTPQVALCSPKYRETVDVVDPAQPSRTAACKDLLEHGIAARLVKAGGDSLVTRMRQCAVHQFMLTDATHLLFWDADIEALDPTCIRTMLAGDKDIVAGACPYKDMTGRVVLNMWGQDAKRYAAGEPIPEWMEVEHAGTGVMLISRKCIVDLMARHPELLHFSCDTGDHRGAPMWAIFDTAIVDMAYLSEDYFFCRLAHDAGYGVWVYTPARFKHYGTHGFEGSVRGMFRQRSEVAESAEPCQALEPR